ncbi:MAG: carbohydrate kinase [Stappiaceae bacterium]
MILVCGDALFDVFIGEDRGRSLSLDAHIGGSPYNVAIGLARQEAACAFLSGLSKDALGRKLSACLSAEGVNTSHIAWKDAACSLSIVGLGDDGSAEYVFYGEGAADRSLEVSDLPANMDQFTAIHVGSYAMVVEPTGSTLLSTLQQEKGKRLISFDPNIRTNVEPDLDVWRNRVNQTLPCTDLVKVSDEDLQLLYPDSSAEDVARKWLDLGPDIVVLSQGAQGATAYTAKLEVHSPGINVEVADTVGAGDTMQSVLLQQLNRFKVSEENALGTLDEHTLSLLLKRAVAAAALTCTRRGADLPTLDQIDAFV